MRRTVLLILALLVPPAASIGIAHLVEKAKYPRRFEEVIPSSMFRGGYPSPDELRRLKQDKNIRAIVSLTDRTDREKDKLLLAEADRLGLTQYRFPMPGNGRGDYAMMDRAAAAVANKENWPVFFHCAAGEQRSNAVLAAYRLKYCQWSPEKVLEELKQYGLDVNDPKESLLWEHIQGYAKHIKTMVPIPASQPGTRDKADESASRLTP